MSARSQRWMTSARCLQVDQWTAEVLRAFQTAGLRPILLKGPPVARWLYPDDPAARRYVDVDVFLGPFEIDRSKMLLRGLGFARRSAELVDEVQNHAELWYRERDGAAVDLHRTLHGCERLADDVVWAEVSATTQRLEVGGVVVETPRHAVLALHVALHVTPHDGPGSQAWLDLVTAVDRVDKRIWHEASGIARRLGIEGEMGTKLRRLSPGLAAELGLTAAPPLQLLLAGQGAGAVAVGRLTELHGIRKKARYCLQKLFPPPSYLRASNPTAGRRPVGVVSAYARRAAWCALRIPAAVGGWRRALHESRGGPQPRPPSTPD